MDRIKHTNSNTRASSGQKLSEMEIEAPSNIIYEQLDLKSFKVWPCPLTSKHNPRKCRYYHNSLDRRRPIEAIYYTSKMCPDMSTRGSCIKGENCQFSHSKTEQAYHADKYRKKFCLYYPNRLEKCPYGQYCSYAHSEEELQADLTHNMIPDDDFFIFHFKTQFCPFNSNHDRAACPYAHNWQDFRRDPSKYCYSPENCPLWDSTLKIGEYAEACPDGFNCPYSHGTNK